MDVQPEDIYRITGVDFGQPGGDYTAIALQHAVERHFIVHVQPAIDRLRINLVLPCLEATIERLFTRRFTRSVKRPSRGWRKHIRRQKAVSRDPSRGGTNASSL